MLLKLFPNHFKKDEDNSTSTIEQRSSQDVVLPSYPAAVAAPNTSNFSAGASGGAYIDSCCTMPVVISRDVYQKIGSPKIIGTKPMNHFGGASEFELTTLDLNIGGLTLMGVEAMIDDTHTQLVVVGKPVLDFFTLALDRNSVQLTPNLAKVATLESYRPKVTLLKVC